MCVCRVNVPLIGLGVPYVCVSVSHALLFFYAEISTHFYASDSVLCMSFCITTYNVILTMLCCTLWF